MNPFHYRMFFTSFSFLFSAIIAWYHDLDYLFLVDLGLFLTSVNYWRWPINNWRRWIDMAWVFVTCVSHIFSVEEWKPEYLFMMLLIDCLYFTCKVSNNSNLTAYCHSIMHIVVVVLFVQFYESSL